MVRDEQHDVFLGAGAHHGDSQWRVGGEIERCSEFALCEHLEAQPLRVARQGGQVVLGPGRPQVGVHGRTRFAGVVDGVGGAQDGVAAGDGVERPAQGGEVDLTADAVGQADVEQGPGRVGGLDEPHAELPLGQLFGRRHGARGVLRRQAALTELAAQQLQAGIGVQAGRP